MAAAIDMRAFATSSHIGREVTFEEAWCETFDQAVTLPEGGLEPFGPWSLWFDVNVVKVRTEGDIMLCLLTYCPFFTTSEDLGGSRLEARYDILAHLFGSEESYLDTLNG